MVTVMLRRACGNFLYRQHHAPPLVRAEIANSYFLQMARCRQQLPRAHPRGGLHLSSRTITTTKSVTRTITTESRASQIRRVRSAANRNAMSRRHSMLDPSKKKKAAKNNITTSAKARIKEMEEKKSIQQGTPDQEMVKRASSHRDLSNQQNNKSNRAASAEQKKNVNKSNGVNIDEPVDPTESGRTETGTIPNDLSPHMKKSEKEKKPLVSERRAK